MIRASIPVPLLLLCIATPAATDHDPHDGGTIAIVIGAEPTAPVPTISQNKANVDVASLLFLPLARVSKALETTVEKNFTPMLAQQWKRRDSLTLVFDLDPRAKWHDGVPVTSRDVVWSIDRARDSTISPTFALLLRNIASVTADGPHRVIFKFKRVYPEQLYDAVYHAPPLPAHLLDTIPPDRLAKSHFASQPIGNGPYRWVKLEPGRQAELAADPKFFLGRPKITRVVFLIARSAEAQLNLLLDGTADAYEGLLLDRQLTPIAGNQNFRILGQPSLLVEYLLFNHRAFGDRTQPHPILGDSEVRRALRLAVDREVLIRSAFGRYAETVDAPIGQATWIRPLVPRQPKGDPAKAKAILASRGWADHDGDGILDRDGTPLSLRLTYPASSLPRVSLAEPIQEMYRRIGVRIELVRLDGPIWAERRRRGEFDIDFSLTTLDPTPSGLVQSWSCAGIGGSNVGAVCDSAFDDALGKAIVARADGRDHWRRAITALQEAAPAVFLFSPSQLVVLHHRYRQVVIRPDLPWADVWTWSVDPGKRIKRDSR